MRMHYMGILYWFEDPPHPTHTTVFAQSCNIIWWKNGDFESIDFILWSFIHNSAAGVGRNVSFLSHSIRLPHPSLSLVGSCEVLKQLIRHAFWYSQLFELAAREFLYILFYPEQITFFWGAKIRKRFFFSTSVRFKQNQNTKLGNRLKMKLGDYIYYIFCNLM